MEKLHLTKVGRYEKKQDGTPYKWPSGDVYVRMAIKAQEYGEKWLSGVAGEWNSTWKEGDEVEVEIKRNPGKDKQGNAVEYLNFSKPSPLADFAKTIMALSVRVGTLEKKVEELSRHPLANAEMPTINEDDVPPPTDEDFQ